MDKTSIKDRKIRNNRGVDRQTRAARARAARSYAIGAQPRYAIMTGQWDDGAIVSAKRRAEDAVVAVEKNAALIERLEEMQMFCEGATGNQRPHPANVARLCRDVLIALREKETSE